MKKIGLIFMVIAMSLAMTGCMRTRVTLEIKEDGAAEVSMLYAISDELMEYAGGGTEEGETESDYFADTLNEMTEEGWTNEAYAEDGYTGYVFTKGGVAIDDIATYITDAEDSLEADSGNFSLTKEGDNYLLNWHLFSDDELDEYSSYATYFENMDGFMEFVLVLPKAAVNSNADEVSEDGKTLTWNLLTMDPEEGISVEFALPKTMNMIPILTCVLVVIILIVICILYFSCKKKKGSAGDEYDEIAEEEDSIWNEDENEESDTEENEEDDSDEEQDGDSNENVDGDSVVEES